MWREAERHLDLSLLLADSGALSFLCAQSCEVTAISEKQETVVPVPSFLLLPTHKGGREGVGRTHLPIEQATGVTGEEAESFE